MRISDCAPAVSAKTCTTCFIIEMMLVIDLWMTVAVLWGTSKSQQVLWMVGSSCWDYVVAHTIQCFLLLIQHHGYVLNIFIDFSASLHLYQEISMRSHHYEINQYGEPFEAIIRGGSKHQHYFDIS